MIKTLITTLLAAASVTASAASLNQYFFAHSLVNHEYENSTQYTNVAYWMNKFTNGDYAATGQYGFLPTVPAQPAWGWQGITSSWESDYYTFEESNINNVVMTVYNFGLDRLPTDPSYFGPAPAGTIADAVKWAELKKPGELTYYLYESWADPAYAVSHFEYPATRKQFDKYKSYNLGHNAWWYRKLFSGGRGQLDSTKYRVKLMPVASVLAKLQGQILADINFNAFYVDDAPHGSDTTYFLAALVMYNAIYGTPPPSYYIDATGTAVDKRVLRRLSYVTEFINSDLHAHYKYSNGKSQVFLD